MQLINMVTESVAPHANAWPEGLIPASVQYLRHFRENILLIIVA